MTRLPGDRALLGTAAVILAVLVPVLAQAHRVLVATWDHNAIRLARSAVLLDGQALYPPPGEGIITASMYGPVSAAAYLPAFLGPTPIAALYLGQVLSTLFFFGGAAAVLFARRPERDLGATVATGALFAVVTIDLWALRYPALTIHADAPTLGLGALAVAFFLRDRPIAATLCAVLAVWSKQVALGVPAALLLHAVLADGRRGARRFGVPLVAWGIGVGLVFVVAFGPIGPMLYHLVEVPGRQPWRWGGGAAALAHSLRLLVVENPALVGLGLALPLLHRLDRGSWRSILARAWSVPALVAVVSLPFALVGRAKVAGDVNAYSHSLFFLLLAVALGLRDLASSTEQPPTEATNPIARRVARALLLLVPVVTLASTLATERDELLRVPASGIPYEAVARYVAERPGRVYLPRMGLVTWYVEGRLDHQIPGLSDFRVAGLPVDKEHLLAGLPPRVDRVLFYENPWIEQERLLGELDLVLLPRDPALPDCLLFAVGDPAGDPGLP